MGEKLKIAGWVCTGVLVGTLATVSMQTVARVSLAPLPLADLQQLAAVFAALKSDYVDPVDDHKLVTHAIAGMVAGLDPHSEYFDKDSFREFMEYTSGRFVGLGVEVSRQDGLLKVVSAIEGSPAQRAGLKVNDLVTKIDDAAVNGLSMNQALQLMRGEPQSKVALTVLRKDENRSFRLTLAREEIVAQSVHGKLVAPGYGWISVSQFQERTPEDFVKSVQALYKAEPKLQGLVLDLRDDPGGLLDGAVAIAAAFLPKDATVVSTDGQLPESKSVLKAAPEFYQNGAADPLEHLPPAIKSVPLVVLVNEGSASASEIVAGALQDHHRGTIVGRRTYGKGSVQSVRPLGDDTGLKLTTAHYYTPSGRSIQGKGIVPDVLIGEPRDGASSAPLAGREANEDVELAQALDQLKGRSMLARVSRGP